MEKYIICVRCGKKLEEDQPEEKICGRCRDVLEFGYPSFLAYMLKEEEEHPKS